MIKIWNVELLEDKTEDIPGKIVDVKKEGIKVSCKRGIIVIKELQEQGGKRMDVATYLNGHSFEVGEVLK